MSASRQSIDALLPLFEALAAGTISAAEHEQLSQTLADSESARIAFHDFMTLEVQLELEFAEAAIEIESDATPDLADAQPRRLASDVWNEFRYYANHFTTLSLLVAGLVITTIVLSLALWTLPVLQPAGDNLADAETVVAWIADSRQARWAADSEMRGTLTTEIYLDQQLELLSGTVELRFNSGARVLLEGPTLFTASGHNGGILDTGKLAARVPEVAVGFTVATPEGTVTDLGTEFEIEVDEGQPVVLDVHEGSVAVAWDDATTAVPRIVQAGQRATLGQRRMALESFAARPSLFNRPVQQASFALRVDIASSTHDTEFGLDTQPGFVPFSRATAGHTVEPQQERYDDQLPTGGEISVEIAAMNGRLTWRDRGDLPNLALGDLVEDFVTTNGTALQLSIAGLPAGRYLMTTYHHDLRASHGTIQITSVEPSGRRIVAEPFAMSGGLKSPRLASFELAVLADMPIALEIEPVESPHVILNGFSIVSLEEAE